MECNSLENSSLAVIMSIYINDKLNEVKFAIESILNQTYPYFNFYIQLDGPIDGEVKAYLEILQDRRIHVYSRSINKGLAQSLNDLLLIIEEQNYMFIARMDADDISYPDRFQKQVDYLQSHKDVDMIGGAINEIDENGFDRGKIVTYPTDPDKCRAFFAKRNPVAHPSVMFRKSFFEKAGWRYPTDYMRNEDTRLWHEGYKNGVIISNIPDVVLSFRVTENMFTQRRNGHEFAKSQLKLRKMIADDLGYGFKSYVYAYAMYLLMISPSWILKLAYKVLR